MAIYKCKMCGGDLDPVSDSHVIECYYCGTKQTVPSADSEKKTNLFNRANRLRMAGEFDKAASVYESILADFPKEAEAYWGVCLCDYGIEYVDDPATAEKIPTCHRASFSRLQDDDNFKAAMMYADESAKELYQREAEHIDGIMADILHVSRNEQPYDVFICYKETDVSGQRTIDSVLAQDLYDALTQKGYRVFFARISLEDKLGRQYEPYIFAALNSAKVMLAVGTSYEYFTATWVQNEWSRFLKLMAKDKSKLLIPCYKDMDAYDLPDSFKMLQAQDLGKIGALQDLLRGLDKVFGKQDSQPNTAAPAPRKAVPLDPNRQNGPLLILNACAIGSDSFTDCWPEGEYDTVFSYDDFQVVYFHLNVNKAALSHKRSVNVGMAIYNSDYTLVFEDVGDMAWQSNYDRIAKSWVIRGSDGSYVPTGTYHVKFWVEDSAEYLFDFTVTSLEEQERQYMELQQERKRVGLCLYCGAPFKKGLFGGMKCTRCGKAKNY